MHANGSWEIGNWVKFGPRALQTESRTKSKVLNVPARVLAAFRRGARSIFHGTAGYFGSSLVLLCKKGLDGG